MWMLLIIVFLVCGLGPPVFAQERYSSLKLQDAAVATGNGTAMPVAQYTSVGVQVTIATTATVVFEVSQNGSTWAAVACVNITSTSSALASSATATGTYQCSVAGMQYFRARISAWTAGAVTVTATATTADLAKVGGGGGTQYAEDTAHTPGENITPLGCRRIDTAASSAGTSGDWATVDCDANGAVRVRIDSTAVGAASDDDDNSIAQGTTGHSVIVNLPYVNNGSAWVRDTVAGRGLVVEDAAETAGANLVGVGTVRRDTPASSAGTSGDNATLNTDQLGRLYTRDANPCSDYSRITHAVISESTAATNEIVALNGSDLIYVCSYKWVTTAANSLNWTRGTGTDCATGTTAIEGAQPYAANGGVAESGGGHPLFVVPAGNALCLVSSAATAHGGRVSYVRTAAP